MARRNIALLTILLFAATLASAHARVVDTDCAVPRGDRIVLYGTADAPYVFVWDSRDHLRRYHEVSFEQAQSLLDFATLVPPGTRAVVDLCADDYVRAKDRDRIDDAIFVRIIDGTLRGRIGWVLGSDVRGVYRPIKH